MVASVDEGCADTVIDIEQIPAEEVVEETERLLKGFANGTRLRILSVLRDGEVCVHEIAEALEVTQSAISHHLRLLRDARIVSKRREGRHVYYMLGDEHIRDMLENALSHGREAL